MGDLLNSQRVCNGWICFSHYWNWLWYFSDLFLISAVDNLGVRNGNETVETTNQTYVSPNYGG